MFHLEASRLLQPSHKRNKSTATDGQTSAPIDFHVQFTYWGLGSGGCGRACPYQCKLEEIVFRVSESKRVAA